MERFSVRRFLTQPVFFLVSFACPRNGRAILLRTWRWRKPPPLLPCVISSRRYPSAPFGTRMGVQLLQSVVDRFLAMLALDYQS